MKYGNTFKFEMDKLKRRSHKRWLYFCFVNKIDNMYTKFSEMTRDQFMEKYKKYITEKGMKLFKGWESTDEYLTLYNLMMQEQSNKDLYKIYEVVRDKALQGDDKAVKTFLLLQKEIKKKSNTLEKSDVDDIESQEENKDDLDITED